MSTKIDESSFKRLEKLDKLDPLKIILFGAAGSGKTWAAGTAGSRVLYLNVGEGILTLKSPLFRSKVQALPIVWPKDVKTWAEIPDLEKFDAICAAVEWFIDNKRSEIDWVILDDASVFNYLAHLKGLQLSNEYKRSQTLDKYNKSKTGIFLPGIQDFGAEIKMVEWFISYHIGLFAEHNIHFMLLAHERCIFTKKLNKDGEPVAGAESELKSIRPGFTGQTFPDNIVRYFDLVWYMENVGPGIYRAKTQGDDVIKAKTRFNGVFKYIEKNPNFTQVVERMKLAIEKGEVTVSEDDEPEVKS